MRVLLWAAALVLAWPVAAGAQDITPPVAGAAADIDFQTSTTTISANWSGFSDAESGIIDYVYQLGTTPGGGEIHGWTDVVLATSFTEGGLTLVDGVTYYVTVQAYNGVVLSTIVSSNGAAVDTTPPAVTAPTAGQIFAAGASTAITWTATDANGVGTNVAIHYSTDGGTTFPNVIAASTPNTGSYVWIVPVADSTLVRVRVQATDSVGNVGDGQSPNLTIDSILPAVAITSPPRAASTSPRLRSPGPRRTHRAFRSQPGRMRRPA